MALNRYVVTQTVTVPPGTLAGGSFGTETATPGAGTYGLWPATFVKGQVIVADPAGALFAAIGSGNLRAYVQGADDAGHAGLAN